MDNVWAEAIDPKSGRTYYYNKLTKQTTWINPGIPSQQFKNKVKDALTSVADVLHNKCTIEYASEDVNHTYIDKFRLCEVLTNIVLSSHLHSLQLLGLDQTKLHTIQQWIAQNKSITMQFKSEEHCNLDHEEIKTLEYDNVIIDPSNGERILHKLCNSLTEYSWNYQVNWEIFIYASNAVEDKIIIQSGSSKCLIISYTEELPHPKTVVRPSIEINLTWFFQQIDNEYAFKFRINRDMKSCKTPRRNQDINAALEFVKSFKHWCSQVKKYFHTLQPASSTTTHASESAINIYRNIFMPVLPLFYNNFKHKFIDDNSNNNNGVQESENKTDIVLSKYDIQQLLAEEKRTMEHAIIELTKVYTDTATTSLINLKEAIICIIMTHSIDVSKSYKNGIDCAEYILTMQLIHAIGKQVIPIDFFHYMHYHYQQIYNEQYRPKPFSYNIRQSQQTNTNEGYINIQASMNGINYDHIHTFVREVNYNIPMQFSINASTSIKFEGNRYIHSWLNHSFGGKTPFNVSLDLIANTRQFSSFILLLGRIQSCTVFDPKAAIILQNKDLVKIPLLLQVIPTAKEFKESIESLSEQQKRFAELYRCMQLESTLFGILIIPIKPQLEKVLNLDEKSLSKQIQLTQDLMKLFIKYQIPSNQLSYDEQLIDSMRDCPVLIDDDFDDDNDDNNGNISNTKLKLRQVKQNVALMYRMIDTMKDEMLDNQTKRYQNIYGTKTEPLIGYNGVDYGSVTNLISEESNSDNEYGNSRSVYHYEEEEEDDPHEFRFAKHRHGFFNRTYRLNTPITTVKPSVNINQMQSIQPTQPTKPSQPANSTHNSHAIITKQYNKPTIFNEYEHENMQQITDFTKLPNKLEANLEQNDCCVRPTIINIGDNWTKTSEASLLSASACTTSLSSDLQSNERKQAFDLLDALTMSGNLTISTAYLHVIIANTHCYDKSLIDSIIQENINPIDELEQASLIIASTIYDKTYDELLTKPHDLLS